MQRHRLALNLTFFLLVSAMSFCSVLSSVHSFKSSFFLTAPSSFLAEVSTCSQDENRAKCQLLNDKQNENGPNFGEFTVISLKVL